MPTFRAISRTVNLASPSVISFILETISLRDADFGLPDLFLSHRLVAGCDIGVRFSVRPSVRLSTFMSELVF